jgi:PIN domain nuclease of toxin-antitoxin system
LEICIAAAELPPIHNDPCDRFIIATALHNDSPVVTTDERFEKYGVTVLG